MTSRRFETLVAVTLAALYLNVVSGTLVRVTGSGLGCPNWPTCTGTQPVPPLSGHALIEFGNRMLALVVVVTTIWTAIAARRSQRAGRTQRRLALATAVGTVAQVPLGGITILTDLHPVAVMSHFVLAVVVVSLATLLAVDVLLRPAPGPHPPWIRQGAVAIAIWTLAVIASGAVVTMAGPHPGDRALEIPRLWSVVDAAYVHVRIAASYVFALAAFLFALSRQPARRPVPGLAWAVVTLATLQILIGEYQWRNALPWWAVLAHVATATALWIAAVAFARHLAVGQPDGSPASVSQAANVAGSQARS